jgi:DNA replication protein DnaC
MTTTPNELDALKQSLRTLGLWGLHAHFDEIAAEPWLPIVIRHEQTERQCRSLQRRLKQATLGSFKPIADFDWSWPKKVDRPLIEELFQLQPVNDGANVIFIGPNGVGKTTLAKNLTHQAIVLGYTARFTTASDMLNDLAAQDSDASLARRLRRYCQPQLLTIDEVGYLSYDTRYADLLFEVVTRRYHEKRPIILTTNKPFAQWTQVFPNAACVVALVDRLIHRSEIVVLHGDSYRLHDAKQRAQRRALERRSKRKSTTPQPRQDAP